MSTLVQLPGDTGSGGTTTQDYATATLNVTADIVLRSVAGGTARNNTTFTTEVLAAAANPTDTVLVAFSGTSAAIVCTVTPNDGTNNVVGGSGDVSATASLNGGVGITLTSTVLGANRNTGTFTINVNAAQDNAGTVNVVFSGTYNEILCSLTPDINTTITPANLVELINDGIITGKTVDLTDDMALRELQTAVGVVTTPFVDGAFGEGSVGTFADGAGESFALGILGIGDSGASGEAIYLKSAASGTSRNTNTFTVVVEAPADNPTDTILAVFTGTAAAITCTITPNDGTNNSATPVDLFVDEFVELINTGAVTGKTVTVTDASSRRVLQTARIGSSTSSPLDTYEISTVTTGNDGLATFAGGAAAGAGSPTPVNLTTAQLVTLINTGAVATVTVTDGSNLRILQTASGGGATALANAGEGDSVLATFAGGVNEIFPIMRIIY